VFTLRDFDPHEMTHGVFAHAGRSLPFLEEGVAELAECVLGSPPYSPPERRVLDEDLFFRASFVDVESEARVTASQFVAFVISSIGWRPFLALYDDVSLGSSRPANAQRVAEAMGMPWEELLMLFEATGRKSLVELCAAHSPAFGVGALETAQVQCLPLATGEIVFGARGTIASDVEQSVSVTMQGRGRLYLRASQLVEPFDTIVMDVGIGRSIAVGVFAPQANEFEIWTDGEAFGEMLDYSIADEVECPTDSPTPTEEVERIGLFVAGAVGPARVALQGRSDARLIVLSAENAELRICLDCVAATDCVTTTNGYYQLSAGQTYYIELTRASQETEHASALLGVIP